MVERLHKCSVALDHWENELAMKFKREIDACNKRLHALREKDDPNSIEEFNVVKGQLVNILNQVEVQWRQLAK